MSNYKYIYYGIVILVLQSLLSCNGQSNPNLKKSNENISSDELNLSPFYANTDTLYFKNAPTSITRSIIQDKIGNIWFATFDGIFKYDGNAFTHFTKGVSDSRFFSLLEDREGNMWFGTIGAGVFRHDGVNFKNFTVDDGLINNEIVCIYQDRLGNIWFGANGGMSRYDGQSFHNYIIKGDSIVTTEKGSSVPNLQRPTNEVNAIIEDDKGRLWMGTRAKTYTFDGKTFTRISDHGLPLQNIRSIIQDQENNIWLGGDGGLWRYNEAGFNHISQNFTGYIYEDQFGNIWTSSDQSSGWALSKYVHSSLENKSPLPNDILTGEGMFFGILEDAEGSIWAGTLNGVYRYDGSSTTLFRNSH